jgi:hypothetical protein
MANADKAVGALVNVREYGGTYIARAKGLGVQASCTAGAAEAVRACAQKVYPDGWEIKRYGEAYTWIATPAKKEVPT